MAENVTGISFLLNLLPFAIRLSSFAYSFAACAIQNSETTKLTKGKAFTTGAFERLFGIDAGLRTESPVASGLYELLH